MKRKLIFFILTVAVLVCIMALSSSATVVISENNLDENGDIVASLLEDLGDNCHLLSVDITYTDINGQDKEGKFYYTTSHWTNRNSRQVNRIYVPNDFDLTQLVHFFDKADFDNDGKYSGHEFIKLYQGGGDHKILSYSSYENGEFKDSEDLLEKVQAVSYSKYFFYFAAQGFAKSGAKSLKTVTYNGKEPIEGALIISPTINEIASGAFGGNGQSFTNNSVVNRIENVIFEDREGSISFGQYCFTRCMIKEIYFGKGTYNLHGSDRIALLFEVDYNNGETATLETVILHKDAKIGSGSISWYVGNYDVVVLGHESDSKEYYESTNQSRLPNAKSVTYNPCYLGHTSTEDFNCETPLICTVCQMELVSAITHNAQTEITYANGYLKNGNKHIKCLNDGCNYDVNIDTSPIFLTNGYSVPEDGRGEIAICFAVNKEALNEYETVSGNYLTYGAFAVAYDKIKNDSIIDTDTAISVEVNREYASFEMKLTGFVTDLHKETKITFGAFTIDKNGIVSYLQSGNQEENNFTYITYNQIVNA